MWRICNPTQTLNISHKKATKLDIPKLSPNFSFSWDELVFNLDFPHPPNHLPRESIAIVNRAKLSKAKLISFISRAHSLNNFCSLIVNLSIYISKFKNPSILTSPQFWLSLAQLSLSLFSIFVAQLIVNTFQ